MPKPSAFVSIQPVFLSRDDVAKVTTLSERVVQDLVRQGKFPQPRRLSGMRVGWLLREVVEWAESRPVSDLPPPPNTGLKRAKPAPVVPGQDGAVDAPT
ncbi:helix-turn-helix transcriptional regulator [Aquabacterium sp.]|uniref:helix-turn-helix transcriptional regulator n=1 Tax=Aquabacterium sp. TaxID=1872578 RepID=UPI0035B476BD